MIVKAIKKDPAWAQETSLVVTRELLNALSEEGIVSLIEHAVDQEVVTYLTHSFEWHLKDMKTLPTELMTLGLRLDFIQDIIKQILERFPVNYAKLAVDDKEAKLPRG